MKALLLAPVLCVAIVVSAEEKLGTGVSVKEVTPIVALVERPADYVGKTIRIDGVATAICEHMGCWMAVAPEGDAKGTTIRLKVEDGVIVFPVSAKGKRVSAQGTFEEVGASDAEGKEAAGEHAKHDPRASKTYQLKATGAVIK
jgi:hypothetical protein